MAKMDWTCPNCATAYEVDGNCTVCLLNEGEVIRLKRSAASKRAERLAYQAGREE